MKPSTWSCVFAGALLCAFGSTVQALDTYRIESIGPGPADPDYRIIYANGMNDKGEVVGGVYGANFGWVWRHGQFTYLSPLPDAAPGAYSEPFAINSHSVIAGVSLDAENNQRPVLWRHGEIRELGAFPDESSVSLSDINDKGVIAGNLFSNTFGISGAVVVFGDHGRKLPALPGGNGFSAASRINELGVIAGTSSSANGLRGVIWTRSGVHDLGTLPGASQVSAGDLNDFGSVTLGLRYGNDTQGYYYRGGVWRNGQISELPLLYTGDVVDTYANGINNRSQVAGGTNVTRITSPGTATFDQYAVVWEGGTAYDVNDLIRADDPLRAFVTFSACQDINNSGQILAMGRDSRAPNALAIYLLTPVRQQ
jgi:uncharacterized membrane protein